MLVAGENSVPVLSTHEPPPTESPPLSTDTDSETKTSESLSSAPDTPKEHRHPQQGQDVQASQETDDGTHSRSSGSGSTNHPVDPVVPPSPKPQQCAASPPAPQPAAPVVREISQELVQQIAQQAASQAPPRQAPPRGPPVGPPGALHPPHAPPQAHSRPPPPPPPSYPIPQQPQQVFVPMQQPPYAVQYQMPPYQHQPVQYTYYMPPTSMQVNHPPPMYSAILPPMHSAQFDPNTPPPPLPQIMYGPPPPQQGMQPVPPPPHIMQAYPLNHMQPMPPPEQIATFVPYFEQPHEYAVYPVEGASIAYVPHGMPIPPNGAYPVYRAPMPQQWRPQEANHYPDGFRPQPSGFRPNDRAYRHYVHPQPEAYRPPAERPSFDTQAPQDSQQPNELMPQVYDPKRQANAVYKLPAPMNPQSSNSPVPAESQHAQPALSSFADTQNQSHEDGLAMDAEPQPVPPEIAQLAKESAVALVLDPPGAVDESSEGNEAVKQVQATKPQAKNEAKPAVSAGKHNEAQNVEDRIVFDEVEDQNLSEENSENKAVHNVASPNALNRYEAVVHEENREHYNDAEGFLEPERLDETSRNESSPLSESPSNNHQEDSKSPSSEAASVSPAPAAGPSYRSTPYSYRPWNNGPYGHKKYFYGYTQHGYNRNNGYNNFTHNSASQKQTWESRLARAQRFKDRIEKSPVDNYAYNPYRAFQKCSPPLKSCEGPCCEYVYAVPPIVMARIEPMKQEPQFLNNWLDSRRYCYVFSDSIMNPKCSDCDYYGAPCTFGHGKTYYVRCDDKDEESYTLVARKYVMKREEPEKKE